MTPLANRPLRLLSWNCSGKFREKFGVLSSLHADICIIQECENPQTSCHEAYRRFASNYLWIGDKPFKGLGVFAREGITLNPLTWKSYCLRHFLPVRVNDAFNLLAVWAACPYIEEYYVYHSIHQNKIDANTIIAGDFNSNQRWDRKHNLRSHSAVVQMMADAGLVSAWHYIHHEPHGQESCPSFYLYRKQGSASGSSDSSRSSESDMLNIDSSTAALPPNQTPRPARVNPLGLREGVLPPGMIQSTGDLSKDNGIVSMDMINKPWNPWDIWEKNYSLETTCEEDKSILSYLESLEHVRAPYQLYWQNCRTFAINSFREIKRKVELNRIK